MMFQVQTKANKELVDVYDVKRDNNGYPHFLVYKDGKWAYLTAKLFEPFDGTAYLNEEYPYVEN